jgi:hypothetical protein
MEWENPRAFRVDLENKNFNPFTTDFALVNA